MNILIVKIGALGDVLRTSFIAQALKDRYKKSNPKITWLTSEKARLLFSNNPYVDNLISYKKDIPQTVFDLVINLEEDNENCKFVSNLNTKKIIGAFLNKKGEIDYSKDSAKWFDMSIISKLGKKEADNLKKKNEKTHKEILEEMLEILPEKYEPYLRLTKIQRNLADSFLRRHNLSRGDLIIGINSGSADRWPKELPIKKTAKLINSFGQKYDAKIILFGGPNEKERNKEIQKYTKVPVIDTGSGNNLEEFPALISVCNLFITTDSLGLHAALALKRKTVCLIGPTSPSEIDMYGLGEKVISNSKDVCSYKTKTDCMDKINLEKIIKSVNKLHKQKIILLITAFKEPKTIGKAIESAINQKTSYDYEILISAPDKETLDISKKYAKKNKNIKLFKDPGKGKSFALNLIFKKIKTDVLILTDGDVWISENSVEEISNMFLDPEIGCVTGRPFPVESKKTKFGFWANFLFEAAHKMRKQSANKDSLIECSGYLFAFKKEKLNEIPLDVAEDTVIPYYFWEKGYKVGYSDRALVYVKNSTNRKDWITQKVRTSKAHETLEKYVDIKTTPRVKTFWNEFKGITWLFKYPKNSKEVLWSFDLAFSRFYVWLKVFIDTKFKSKNYNDSWERIESTK